ncbi:MAG: hypothetical protein ACI81L_000646, partial [Verrucomicrobiales bacterium]
MWQPDGHKYSRKGLTRYMTAALASIEFDNRFTAELP